MRRQVDALAQQGYICKTASELEFYLFNNSYPDAFAAGYRNLTPSSDYRIDYHTMQPAREETLFRAVRNQMCAAGVPVESSKGEWGRGQHEVNFVYGDPLPIADMHTVFKQGIKEIAAQQGRSITFMAKPSMSEPGNSCHIHCSFWKDGRNAFAEGKDGQSNGGHTRLFRQFLGGLLKYSPELCYFFGPTINSYKRYQPGSWAPTKMAWSHDNRTVGFRVVGHGNGLRIENRMPGADANPYLAFAATIAAGMAGIRENLDCARRLSRQRLRRSKTDRASQLTRASDSSPQRQQTRPRILRPGRRRFLHPHRRPRSPRLQQLRHRLGKNPLLRTDLIELQNPAPTRRASHLKTLARRAAPEVG